MEPLLTGFLNASTEAHGTVVAKPRRHTQIKQLSYFFPGVVGKLRSFLKGNLRAHERGFLEV